MPDPTWWLAAAPVVALGNTLLNAATWTRGAPDWATPLPRTSALVPARNEGSTIEACVESLLALPVVEVLVLDDHSTDDTAARVLALAHRDPRVSLLRGRRLPEGWLGKAHACHQLAEAASGELLLFVDADVRMKSEAAPAIASLIRGAHVVTAVPRQLTGSWAEHLILPLLHLTYTSWLPLALIPRVSAPSVLAANGQVIAVRRSDYARIGGYAAVRTAVVDDMAFCRRAKQAGLTVCFADADTWAMCRMYQGATEVWRGFSKNLYPGIGGSPAPLAATVLLYLFAFVVPWFLWPWAPEAALMGISANLLQRGWLTWRHHQHPLGLVLQPVAVLGLLALAVHSAWWTHSGKAEWRGRRIAVAPEAA